MSDAKDEEKKIIIISGATACGKSDLAMKFAEKKNAAIINADSLQIYQGLPILSSQPSSADQKKVTHFLYSHFSPSQNSSVGIWLNLVKSVVEECRQTHKTPVVVGGSGMYLAKLIDGISTIPEILPEFRNEARQLYDEIGHADFQKKLIAMGEDEILDKQRLTRAYEVLRQTGKPIFWWQNQPLVKIFAETNFVHVNLNLDREKLYQNCNLRFVQMLKNGAIEEVQSLVNQGTSYQMQISKTLGFLEICDLLSGKKNQEKTIEIVTQKTRNYAKRQLTWFRHQMPQKLVFAEQSAALNFLLSTI